MSQKLRRVLAIIAIVFMLLFFVSLIFIFGRNAFLKEQMPFISTIFGIIGIGLWAVIKFDETKKSGNGRQTKDFSNKVIMGAEDFEKEIEQGSALTEDEGETKVPQTDETSENSKD